MDGNIELKGYGKVESSEVIPHHGTDTLARHTNLLMKQTAKVHWLPVDDAMFLCLAIRFAGMVPGDLTSNDWMKKPNILSIAEFVGM